MASNVRVAVRVRPLLDHEREAGHTQRILQVDSERNLVNIHGQQ